MAKPMENGRFLSKAKPIALKGGGVEVTLYPREYALGSFGWHAQGTVEVVVDGVTLQLSVNFLSTVKGSKPK